MSSIIQKAKEEKWFRGDLGFKLHSAQKLIDKTFKQTKGQLFVGNCSRQLGKSYWAVVKAVEQAIKKPKSQIRYGAAFHTDLIDFIIPAFDKILEDCPPAIRGKYRSSGTSFIFPNGSRIKLVGLDKNPNGLRGNTLDLIILDECGFVSNLDYIYRSVIIPATTHRPDAKIILISTPPSTAAHPFIDYAQRAELEGSYAKYTIYDNPMVDKDTIARLMKEAGGAISTTWRREYLCEPVTDEDLALVKEWNDSYIQEIPRDEYYVYYHKYVAMDLGRKDHTIILFGYYDFKKATLFIEDEILLDGPSWTTITMKDAIKAKELELWGEERPFRRISDNNNPHLIQDLASLHNLSFQETDKESLEAMLNEVRIMVGAGRVKVNPKCVMTIGCFKYGVWDKHRREFARSKTYGHYDALAAAVYLIRNLAKHSNPIPVTHGHTNDRSWLGNVKNPNLSHNHKTLTNALIPKPKKITGKGFT